MDVFTERAHLLAILSRLYPAHAYQPDDAEDGFTYVVCIHFPWGQGAWHIADDDYRTLFHGSLTYTPVGDYDGHTTEGKYRAIREALADGVW